MLGAQSHLLQLPPARVSCGEGPATASGLKSASSTGEAEESGLDPLGYSRILNPGTLVWPRENRKPGRRVPGCRGWRVSGGGGQLNLPGLGCSFGEAC